MSGHGNGSLGIRVGLNEVHSTGEGSHGEHHEQFPSKRRRSEAPSLHGLRGTHRFATPGDKVERKPLGIKAKWRYARLLLQCSQRRLSDLQLHVLDGFGASLSDAENILRMRD